MFFALTFFPLNNVILVSRRVLPIKNFNVARVYLSRIEIDVTRHSQKKVRFRFERDLNDARRRGTKYFSTLKHVDVKRNLHRYPLHADDAQNIFRR